MMSEYLNDGGISIGRLVGQANYQRWVRDFQAIAQMKCLWKYFTGDEVVVIRPSKKLHEQRKHDGQYNACRKCDAAIKAWSNEQTNIQQAMGLLRYWIDPAIRCDIPQSLEDPHLAWEMLERRHRMYGNHAREFAEARMKAVHFNNFKTVSAYMNEINLVWKEIQMSGGRFMEEDFVFKVTGEMPKEYRKYHGLGLYLDQVAVARHPNIKELTSRLLVAEVEIKARKQNAAARA